jgi:outer membrane biosynthesis protein TonB
MLNYHRSFKDALLSVLLKIPAEGKSAVSYPIVLHEGRKAGGQQILVEFPALPNLADEKSIRFWLQHSDTGEGSVDDQGLKPPGGINPPDDNLPPKTPPKDPKKDPETPKDPKKDPKQPEDPEPEPNGVSSWETVSNAGMAVVTGIQEAATKQYMPLPVDVKKYLRAVISVDKDAGDNTSGLVAVSLVY